MADTVTEAWRGIMVTVYSTQHVTDHSVPSPGNILKTLLHGGIEVAREVYILCFVSRGLGEIFVGANLGFLGERVLMSSHDSRKYLLSAIKRQV